MNIYQAIDDLITYARENLELDARNENYVRNTLLERLSLDVCAKSEEGRAGELASLLKNFVTEGIRAGIFSAEEEEKYCDLVLGALSLSPAEIDDRFHAIFQEKGAKAATDWLYGYCVKNDYVKKEKLDKNPRFETPKGLIVTINRAKPEFRDPQKAAGGNAVKGGYPKCVICRENEGFGARNKRTLRTVRIELGGREYFWQFSPYGYFYQHGIAVNAEHTPMRVDRQTFENLLDFVDIFPHWFIGCNAALPRIGGSVLAHDHYQGGGETLPLFKAKNAYLLRHGVYKNAVVSVLDWPGTAVRIIGADRREITALAEIVSNAWLRYRNEEKGVIPVDEEGIHSAVSPTVIKIGQGYEMNLILRNNITSEKYPDGVFHAHPEYHMIKKESIGLIEAQGLFILPGRLEEQLGEIENLIASGKDLTDGLKEFKLIYDKVKSVCPSGDREGARRAVREELGDICYRILQNTAVFKTQEETAEFLKESGFEDEYGSSL